MRCKVYKYQKLTWNCLKNQERKIDREFFFKKYKVLTTVKFRNIDIKNWVKNFSKNQERKIDRGFKNITFKNRKISKYKYQKLV